MLPAEIFRVALSREWLRYVPHVRGRTWAVKKSVAASLPDLPCSFYENGLRLGKLSSQLSGLRKERLLLFQGGRPQRFKASDGVTLPVSSL